MRAVKAYFDHEGTTSHAILPWHVALRHVSTLAEAEQAISTAPPSVVVADLNLPDSRGAQTVHALRRIMPRGPLIILTGQNDASLGLTAGLYGAEFLDKDRLTPDALWRTLLTAISRDHDPFGGPSRHIEPSTL